MKLLDWSPIIKTLKEMTASESVYGFVAWLTTRDEEVTFGATHNAAIAAELVEKWCVANDLTYPRDNYSFKMPEEEDENSINADRST